jgi:hypothetical protein
MRKIIVNSIIISSVLLGVFSSCTGIRSNMLVQGKDPFKSWEFNLWFQRQDLEELGMVSDSIQYSNYLGIRFLSSNKDFRYTKRISYPTSGILFDPYLSRVLYYLHEKQPNADIIIPTKVITKTQRLFLGSRNTVTVVGKAYKLK